MIGKQYTRQPFPGSNVSKDKKITKTTEETRLEEATDEEIGNKETEKESFGEGRRKRHHRKQKPNMNANQRTCTNNKKSY